MRTLCYILLLLCTASHALAQQHDIYLKTLPMGEYRSKLILESPTDSSYVHFIIPENDADIFYQLNEILPDGLYRVFIDGKLQMSGSMKHNRKHLEWRTRVKYDDWEVNTYQNGEADGMQATYDSTGRLAIFAWVNNGFKPVITHYARSGKVQCHKFNLGTGPELLLSFDEYGYLQSSRQTTYNNCRGQMLDFEGNFKKGRLEGISKLHLIYGVLSIEFKDNEIIGWQFEQDATQGADRRAIYSERVKKASYKKS